MPQAKRGQLILLFRALGDDFLQTYRQPLMFKPQVSIQKRSFVFDFEFLMMTFLVYFLQFGFGSAQIILR